jgi:hypothetical protein
MASGVTMLSPEERAILREQLKPEPGDHLEIAVATTFTLDLTAALVAPLSFASFDLAGAGDPVAVLEAVRSAADRVTVFSQIGEVRVPSTASDLMSFLEPMIYEVSAPKAGYLFHPKIWVLRYGGPNGTSHRLLCGSRNLTGDVSWDAMVRIDGVAEGVRSRPANRPLADLVEALPNLSTRRLPPERLRQVMELGRELRTIVWQLPPDVTSLAFHTFGLHRRRGTPPIVEAMQGRRVLIVAPFLDDAGLAGITDDTEATVVSRPEAFERLAPATLAGLSCRIVNPLAGLADPEDAAEESARSQSQGVLGGLHAKVYVIERANQAHLFLGSPNATSAGLFDQNVEFLVEMSGGRRALGIDAFIGPDAGFARMLETYDPTGGAIEPLEETIGRELETILRRVADAQFTATVGRQDEFCDETVTSSMQIEFDAVNRLTLSLLTRPGKVSELRSGSPANEVFADLPLADVSPFVVLRAQRTERHLVVERATVVRATLVNDPEDRLDEVIARQVDTPEKFLRFLALLLGLGESPLATSEDIGGDSASSTWFTGTAPGLFELLVRSVADRPQAIDDLDRLITRLRATERGREILPDGFTELWSITLEARQRVAEVPV